MNLWLIFGEALNCSLIDASFTNGMNLRHVQKVRYEDIRLINIASTKVSLERAVKI
jgi:hypothetical protein